MSQTESTTSPETKASPWWQRIPLTLQILIALVAAASVGIALGAGNPNPSNATLINNLAIPSELVLKALRALATPLILVAVLLALALQACYYLTRVKFGSWVHPLKLFAGGSDGFLTAFSTSSCAAAMPITFEVLEKSWFKGIFCCLTGVSRSKFQY